MTGTAVLAAMSSTGSNSPVPMEVSEEPRKKGARGGKRSVTHLSKAQLARKRANDREAQRNIRQRTKEHIENLERKVKELEQGQRSSSIERVMRRNKELEDEVKKLRAQVSAHQPSGQIPPEIPEELLIPQKVSLEWMPESPAEWPASNVSQIPPLEADVEIPVSNPTYPATAAPLFPSTSTTVSLAYEDEASQPLYAGSGWGTQLDFGPQTSSSVVTKPIPAWAPFHDSFSQPSRFSDLQTSGFNNLINDRSSYNIGTTCWQSQPSVYAFSISTKLKAPSTYVDHLMLNVIQSQRHLAITEDVSQAELLGPAFPSVHILFGQPGPIEAKPSKMTEVMSRYSEVLANRGFALIPEKLASFMCMYRFVQWQISPNYQTYQTLHEWQAPRPSQLMIPHPAWMDLPPWGKFREKVIENQDRYDNVEFQNDYARNLCVNFPHDPLKALVFEGNQIMISPVLEKHLSDISNMSMKKPFADKYPEFREVCRFDEV
jgi:TolA-binding protein